MRLDPPALSDYSASARGPSSKTSVFARFNLPAEEPYAVIPHTDLWEPRVSNHLRPPSPLTGPGQQAIGQ